MIAERFPELMKLSIEEKRILLEELYEEVYPSDGPDPRIVEILEKRWQAHIDDPSSAVTLEEFRKRLTGS